MNTIQIKMSTVVLLATLMSGLTSCSDFLDEKPYGQLTSENFFSNKEDTRSLQLHRPATITSVPIF